PPTQHGWPNVPLLPRRNLQKARAKWPAQPLVAARGVEVAAQPIDIQRHLGDRVGSVDSHCNSSLGGAPADVHDRQDYRRGTTDMTSNEQTRALGDRGENRLHRFLWLPKWQRQDDRLRD